MLRRVVERVRPLLNRLAIRRQSVHVLRPASAARSAARSPGVELVFAISANSGARSDFSVARMTRLGFVARLDQQPRREVGLGVLERIEQHALDFLVGEAVGRLHLDRLLDVGAQLAAP